MSSRYLTKSRFKIGAECPTKLHYHDDPSYGSTKTDDAFLKALADGGFQVGELAKLYHPGGVEITTRDKAEAIEQTKALLQNESAIIYEAAFMHDNLFIKADLVIKRGNTVELIEVKSKSWNPDDEEGFFTKTSIKKGAPQLSSDWRPYVLDIAFQAYVVAKAYPKLTVLPFLMLADKSKRANVDGLNQRFFLEKADKETRVKVKPGTTQADLGEQILVKVDALEAVQIAWGEAFPDGKSFQQKVDDLMRICQTNEWTPALISGDCKSCEFRIKDDQKAKGLKSGFEKCWSHTARLKPEDFNRPMIFDIWNFRKSDKLVEEGVYFMDQLSEEDIAPESKDDEPGLSNSERQWLQVEKAAQKDATPYLDHEGLAEEMKSWTYPLHFIDFETTMVAIPFNKGRRPYEQTAFQFSHHTVTESGEIRHENEYINTAKGVFPNFEFVRRLKNALSKDNGTIFRYAAHENTVLNQIKAQLEASTEPDRAELITFIDSITTSGEKKNKRVGPRAMVDMLVLVRSFFYCPTMVGSNSIKKVLPAILSKSQYLRDKYGSPIYGTKIPSRNFANWAWVQLDESGKIIDPYKLLPPVFSDLDLETMDSRITEKSLEDGGAAMTAYARMQFTEMSESECDRVTKALLKYCELDTFAMVMIWEHLKEEVDKAAKKAA